MTHQIFIDDSYARKCEAKITAIGEKGEIVLDQSVFYATSGGQPGDTGHLILDSGTKINVTDTIKDKTSGGIALIVEEHQHMLEASQSVTCHLNWQRRHKLMQMHSACHILSVVCPYPITSAGVGENESRVDFDMPELPGTKSEISRAMMELINANHPIFDQWIDESELDANPGLVKSKNVKPPRGLGRIRLVCIGENSSIDSQPCGGTHVKSTAEIGEIHIGKIEKKGKENRRFRIRFGPSPAI